VIAKVYSKDDGSSRGGQPMQRGALYRMLQNPIYRGQVRHRDTVYEGEHDAIVDDSLWKQVQERLQANRIADGHKTSARSPSLLAGLVWTEQGDPFTPSHASKKGKRYRYYVSRPQPERQEPRTRLWRIPAADLETLVLDQVTDLLGSVPRLRAMLRADSIAEFDQQVALDRAAALAEQLTDTSLPNLREDIRVLIVRVTVAEAGVAIRLSRQTLLRLLGLSDANSQKQTVIDLNVPVRLRRAGMEMRLIDERTATGPDPVLIALLSKAWTVRQDMLSGKVRSQADLAANHGVGSTYLGRLLRIGFLAPDIIETILGGRQPPDLTANRLAMIPDIPVDWDEQRKLILGNSRSRV
jgi:hypothetical protein